MAACVCWGCWAVYTHRTADALAHGAGLALTLSPRFSLEVHCLLPTAWGLCALAVAFATELLWSWLGTGVFLLAPKPAMNSFLESPGSKAVPALLLLTAYKVRRHVRAQGEMRWPCMHATR